MARNEVCRNVDIRIEGSDILPFVTEEGIRSDLGKLGIKLEGERMGDINSANIEKALKSSEYIESVHCVKCLDGRILLQAKQLVPVMRVFDGDDSYYLNRDGKRMTATANYHTDVPVVQGHFQGRFTPLRMLPLIEYVESDSLLRTLVTMYLYRDSNNIYFVPNIYGHIVNLGNLDNIPQKFDKLKLFYAKVMPEKGWNTYDTISVKWDHQVVATKRNKVVPVPMDYDPEEDEQMPDAQTMTIDDNPAVAQAKTNTEQKAKPQNADKKTAEKKTAEKKADEKKPAAAKATEKKEKTTDNKKQNN